MGAATEDAIIATDGHLTPRERDVVSGVAAGQTNREIADELGLSEQSVKNVLSTVYLKCGVRNRLELALSAVRHRLAAHPRRPRRRSAGAHQTYCGDLRGEPQL